MTTLHSSSNSNTNNILSTILPPTSSQFSHQQLPPHHHQQNTNSPFSQSLIFSFPFGTNNNTTNNNNINFTKDNSSSLFPNLSSIKSHPLPQHHQLQPTTTTLYFPFGTEKPQFIQNSTTFNNNNNNNEDKLFIFSNKVDETSQYSTEDAEENEDDTQQQQQQDMKNLNQRKTGVVKKSSRGKWTDLEDKRLEEGVMQYSAKNWKKIAEYVGNERSSIQCLHRWQKVLNPNLIKGKWSIEEDEKLRSLVQSYGTEDWTLIAERLGTGRIGKQCRERWYNHLTASINKEPFTAEEDEILLKAHEKYGNKWSVISKFLNGRTDNSVKNRYHSLVYHKKKGTKPKQKKKFNVKMNEKSITNLLNGGKKNKFGQHSLLSTIISQFTKNSKNKTNTESSPMPVLKPNYHSTTPVFSYNQNGNPYPQQIITFPQTNPNSSVYNNNNINNNGESFQQKCFQSTRTFNSNTPYPQFNMPVNNQDQNIISFPISTSYLSSSTVKDTPPHNTHGGVLPSISTLIPTTSSSLLDVTKYRIHNTFIKPDDDNLMRDEDSRQ